MRGRLAFLALLPLLAGRVEASWVDDAAAWLPVQAVAQEQTEATAVIGQGFTEMAKTVGKEGLLGNVNMFSNWVGVPTALLSGDVDGAMEEAANAALSSGVVFVFTALGTSVGGPLAPLTGVAGALFGGFVYRQSGIENRIRGHFQKSSDERGSEVAAERLGLRDRLPPIQEACGDAVRFVGEAQALIPPPGGAGTQVDDLFGQVGETEAAVQALGSRIDGTDLAGVHGGEGDEGEIIRELADLEWIAGELCRIAQQAATSDVEGARRAWESEGRFLAGRIETRSTSVLARIDRAEQALRAAQADRASQRAEVGRLAATVDSLSARVRSARESVAAAQAGLERGGRLLEEAAAPLADCVRMREGLIGVIKKVALGRAFHDGALVDLWNKLDGMYVPAFRHQQLTEELASRRGSLQRSASYLDGFAGALQGLRASLDQWRGLLSAADAGGYSPAQARSEAEIHRRKAEECRGRAEALASGRSAPAAGLPSASTGASGSVSVPDLRGKSRALAEAWLTDLGLRPVVTTLDAVPPPGREGTVESQAYPGGSALPAGAFVGVTAWGGRPPDASSEASEATREDPAGATTQAGCDRDWPGTVLARDPATGQESCRCPSGMAWSKVSRTCLALPGGIAGGAVALGGCSHMPGTIRDSRTGECRCALGTWDETLRRCVDTAAAGRAQDVAAKQAAAECENLYSRIRVFRLSTDAVGQAAAAEAERGAVARGCDVTRIAEAKGPPPRHPVGGGTGSGPPVAGGSGTGGGGLGRATCQITEQPGAGGVTLVYEQTALGNHTNVYVFTAPKEDAGAVEAHWSSQSGFRLVGRFGSYSQGLSVAKKACAKRTAPTGEADSDAGLCNCVDEKGKRYTDTLGQPCGTPGSLLFRDYRCP